VTEAKSMMEIYEAGVAALTRELGPVGMIRFLQFFGSGHGDYTYTKERHAWLKDLTIDDIMREARKPQRD
jgi:hypothetical protein